MLFSQGLWVLKTIRIWYRCFFFFKKSIFIVSPFPWCASFLIDLNQNGILIFLKNYIKLEMYYFYLLENAQIGRRMEWILSGSGSSEDIYSHRIIREGCLYPSTLSHCLPLSSWKWDRCVNRFNRLSANVTSLSNLVCFQETIQYWLSSRPLWQFICDN